MQFTDFVHSIRHLDTSLQKGVSSVANCALSVRNWVIGAWILEFEQDGAERAAYGERLVPDLAGKSGAPGTRGLQPVSQSAVFRPIPRHSPDTVWRIPSDPHRQPCAPPGLGRGPRGRRRFGPAWIFPDPAHVPPYFAD
jgi:hypothetical protein